ncbi:hypothetical protein KY290_017209 [Solanum tuberosum]|uniref:Uncharacterized protein n=1 Tax=Solanum tuberosum TaxID=4113 RepID=A0ABQ7VCK3_SOLTU|nr:hypothetical protein KY284_016243 [Solanum tuberosum]KAH0701973.1 hypothetical protein KY285_016251 [Solanum tuberosum]KAH0761136.1 hypothetical protein KY290_017209 [Solanum tuberosum]
MAIVDDGEFHVLNEDMIDTSLRVRVNIGVGVGAGVDLGCGIDAGAGGKSVEATSYNRCSGFQCEKCKKHDDNSIKYFQTLTEAVNELKY